MSGEELTILLAIGLLAGLMGGLLGIGGSVIFIPLATFALGPDQQIYQAAAMLLNVAVAGTATIKHYRKGAIRASVVKRMLPAAMVLIIVGVLLSNALSGQSLLRIFGALLWIIAIMELLTLLRDSRTAQPQDTHEAREGWPVLGSIGGFMGFVGGLMGIGGGIFAVPMLRNLAGFQMRQAVAAAACVTLPMALIGATLKNATLHRIVEDGVPLSATTSLGIACAIIPTAIIGSWLGATLVHRLPIGAIRLAFIILLVFAGFRMSTGIS